LRGFVTRKTPISNTQQRARTILTQGKATVELGREFAESAIAGGE
jgi:hypothetical protein